MYNYKYYSAGCSQEFAKGDKKRSVVRKSPRGPGADPRWATKAGNMNVDSTETQ